MSLTDVEIVERQIAVAPDSEQIPLYKHLGRVWEEKLGRERNALDACTGIQLTCDQMGGAVCEAEGNGACSGKGPASSDCDHCCGGVLK